MTFIDDNHAILWTWDEPVPFIRPSHESGSATLGGYRLPLALLLGAALVALLTLAVLVVLGAL